MTEYVEREDLVKHLNILYNRLCEKSPHFHDGFLTAVDYVKEFSDSDVSPVVHSYWEHKITIDGENIGICHNCKYPISWFYGITKYCPNCGAKMDECNESEN